MQTCRRNREPRIGRAHRGLTAILARRTVGSVTGDVEDGAFDGYQGWAAGIGTCEHSAQCLSVGIRGEAGTEESAGRGMCIPSHLANSSVEMGSSFGGSSWTGTLGAKRSDIVV